MASPGSATRTSFGEAAYHEFYHDDFEPRAHYRPLWEHIRAHGPERALGEAARGALDAPDRRRDVHRLRRRGRGHRARLAARPAAADHPRRRVGAARGRASSSACARSTPSSPTCTARSACCSDGVVPPELIYHGKDFRREIHGIEPPLGLYVHVAGIDLVRDERGRYLVLEDNLRTPSGVSYMIENRIVERRTLPEFFARYRVRRVEHYPALLLQALRELSPRGKDQRRGRAAHARHLQLGLLRAHLPRARDGHRAGRGPRPRRRERRGPPEDHERPPARGRALPPHRRRLPRPALLPPRLDARRGGRDQRLARRQRRDRERARHRHRRRQGGLPLRAGADPLLPRRDAAPRERADLPHDGARGARLRARQPAATWW